MSSRLEGEAEQRLLALEQELTARALAQDMMIHDVRNPLSSIISIADMLSARAASEDDKVWIMRILELGHRTLNILKATAGYARMERGNHDLEASRFDLLTCLEAALGKLTTLQESRSLTVERSLDGHPFTEASACWVEGDRFFLEQLFHNLITNALEASPPRGTVSISLQMRQSLVVVIHNQGVVPVELRDKIFDKLSSYQSLRGGGLGGYIAKLVAEQHGGTVHFTTDEQQGTTFTVELPILSG